MARAATRQVRREAAAILRGVIDTVERGELEAPAWFLERLLIVAVDCHNARRVG